MFETCWKLFKPSYGYRRCDWSFIRQSCKTKISTKTNVFQGIFITYIQSNFIITADKTILQLVINQSSQNYFRAQNILKEALNSDKLILRIVPYNVPVYYANKTENSPSTKHRSIPVTSTPAKDSEQNTPLKSRFPRPSFGKAGVSLPSGPFSTPAPRPTSSQPFKTQRNVPSTCSKINQSQQQRQEASQEARSMASTDLCSTPMTRTPAKNDTTPKRVGFLRTAKTMNIQLSKGFETAICEFVITYDDSFVKCNLPNLTFQVATVWDSASPRETFRSGEIVPST